MKQFLTKGVPWLLGLGLLASLWSKLSLQDVRHAFEATGWWLIPIVALSLLWMPTDTFALSRILPPRSFGWRLGLIEWASESFNSFIPIGGMGGEPFRYRHLRSYTAEPVKVLVAFRGTHAWTGLAATVIACALCWWTGQPGNQWRWLTGVGCVAFLIFCGVAWFARTRFWGHMSVQNLLMLFVAKMWGRLMQVSEVGVILWALGAEMTWERLLIVHASLLVAASLFVFIPGGYGVQEKALVMGTQFAGLGPEIGLKLGLLRRFRQLAWSALGLAAAAYLEASRKRYRNREQQLDQEPAA